MLLVCKIDRNARSLLTIVTFYDKSPLKHVTVHQLPAITMSRLTEKVSQEQNVIADEDHVILTYRVSRQVSRSSMVLELCKNQLRLLRPI